MTADQMIEMKILKAVKIGKTLTLYEKDHGDEESISSAVANKSFLNLDPFQHLSNNSPTFFFKKKLAKALKCRSPSMLWGENFRST